jgi:hypothetical protein
MIEVKNVKICQWMSEETLAFECSVYYKNKRVGYAKNDGKGGCNYIHVPRSLREEMDKWCKNNLPKWGCSTIPSREVKEEEKIYDMDLELHISELVSDWDRKKWLKRLVKKDVVVVDDTSKKGEYWNYSKKKYARWMKENGGVQGLFNHVKKNFKNPVCINSLTIEDGVDLMF